MAGESNVVAKPVKKLIETRVGTADDDAARKLAERKGLRSLMFTAKQSNVVCQS
jgi:hypothetical protein